MMYHLSYLDIVIFKVWITDARTRSGDLEQLDYPARPITQEAEDDPNAGDASLYRQLLTDL